MGAFVCKIFAVPLVWFYEKTGSYGLAIIFFALLVNLIMSPFMAKSKKSMMRTTRLQPRIQELQKRHEGNQRQLQAEMQKLYNEEGINPMSGCLWSLIPFPILIALYSVIRQPMTRMMFIGKDVVELIRDFFVNAGLYVIPSKPDNYLEITLSNLAHQHWGQLQAAPELAGKLEGLMDIDFGFLGLNLGMQPKWNFFTDTDWSQPAIWLPALGLFLIPFISAFLSWLTMKVANSANPTVNDQSAASMQSMTLMMPLMSIWICFIMPAAMGVYWIANSIFGMGRDLLLTKIYKKKIDAEFAEKDAARLAREKEIEAKRLETERLRAEGKSTANANTSKKNIRAREQQQLEERKAALEREERAARRERRGEKEHEIPASQVGNRRYARGRAYVPDRFSNPEQAEEQTLAAAAESEFAPAIDETVLDCEVCTEAVAAELSEAVELAAQENGEASVEE